MLSHNFPQSVLARSNTRERDRNGLLDKKKERMRLFPESALAAIKRSSDNSLTLYIAQLQWDLEYEFVVFVSLCSTPELVHRVFSFWYLLS